MDEKRALIFNCTVSTHDYSKLINIYVTVIDEDICNEGEWVLVMYDDVPYVINQADIDIIEE